MTRTVIFEFQNQETDLNDSIWGHKIFSNSGQDHLPSIKDDGRQQVNKEELLIEHKDMWALPAAEHQRHQTSTQTLQENVTKFSKMNLEWRKE